MAKQALQLTQAERVTLIAAERRDPESLLLARQLTRAGARADVAESYIALQQRCQGDPPPAAILLDQRLPYAVEAGRWLKLNPRRARTTVVTVHGPGTDPLRPAGFYVHGDAALVEPFENETLERALSRDVPDPEHKVMFSFPEGQAPTAIKFVEELLAESGVPAGVREPLQMAFREAVDNAVRHGNKHRPGTLVWAEYRHAPGRVEFEVRDEGAGFDAQLALTERMSLDAASAARTTYIKGRRGGLGMIMMRRCVDEVAYEGNGNHVRLTKHLS